MLTRKTAETKPDEAKEGGIGELISTVLWALGIALVLRTFIFQPFTIPSGSMYPGLEVGDYIITSKYSVGYGRHAASPFPFPDVDGRLLGRGPDRGDVIVFRPEGSEQNFIKRVVGLPGDRVQMVDGRLQINGEATHVEALGQATYQHRNGRDVIGNYTVDVYRETLPGQDGSHLIYDAERNGRDDDTQVFTVPAGHYFMMGDNRDFSGDSRIPVRALGAGYVPEENIIGRAEFVMLSVDKDFYLFKPWTWGNINGERFFKRIR